VASGKLFGNATHQRDALCNAAYGFDRASESDMEPPLAQKETAHTEENLIPAAVDSATVDRFDVDGAAPGATTDARAGDCTTIKAVQASDMNLGT